MALTLHTVLLQHQSPKLPFPPQKTHFPNCTILFTPQQPPRLSKIITASFRQPYGGASPHQVAGDNNNNNNTAAAASFDAFLSAVEFLSLASSAAVCVYVAVRFAVQKGGRALGWVWGKVVVWQCVVLVAGLAAGAVIRRRQWRRVCGIGYSSSSAASGVNLLERVEKLEEDLRSSAAIVQALSRRLEKLGIRFRLTRKALKEPIAETAALVQKNSEATQALAAQEGILEKELGEIQKVLLAMQEQQQKQLELILAIGTAGKLWETKRAKSRDQKVQAASKSPVDELANSEMNQIETLSWQKESNNDRP